MISYRNFRIWMLALRVLSFLRVIFFLHLATDDGCNCNGKTYLIKWFVIYVTILWQRYIIFWRGHVTIFECDTYHLFCYLLNVRLKFHFKNSKMGLLIFLLDINGFVTNCWKKRDGRWSPPLTYAAISRKNEDFEICLMTRRFTFFFFEWEACLRQSRYQKSSRSSTHTTKKEALLQPPPTLLLYPIERKTTSSHYFWNWWCLNTNLLIFPITDLESYSQCWFAGKKRRAFGFVKFRQRMKLYFIIRTTKQISNAHPLWDLKENQLI